MVGYGITGRASRSIFLVKKATTFMVKILIHCAFCYYSFKMDDIGIIKLSHGGSFEKEISDTFLVSIGLKNRNKILVQEIFVQ